VSARWGVVGAALIAVLCPASPAIADSFTPVRMGVTIAPVARLGAPLHVTIAVSADAGVLDVRQGPMRVGVKLASECGGTFETTPGTTLLSAQLSPQPATGKAYAATASGSGAPSVYGVQTVCVYLQDGEVGRVFASDQSQTVDVSRSCTAAAGRYDSAQAALTRSRRRLRDTKGRAGRRRLRQTIARRTATARRDRRQALAACGSGVRL
jgi:hypothetical protein